MQTFLSADVHARTITYAVFYGGQVVEQPKRIDNTLEELEQLAKTYPGQLVLVEACGHHEFVHDALTSAGMTVKAFVAPRREPGERKNDREDALRLGRRYLAHDLREVWTPPTKIRELRSLVQTRVRLAQQGAGEKSRIQMTLHHSGFWKLNPLLERKPLDDEVRARVLAARPLLQSSYDLIDLAETHARKLDRRIEEEGSQLWPVRRMRSIPGFGPLVTLAYYAHVGNVERFLTADHLLSYLGLDPMWEQSGDALRDLHTISHTGPEEVRLLLNQAAWAHATHAKTSTLTRTYARKARTNGKQNAIVGLMGDLAKAAYAVWKNDRDFTMKRPPRSMDCRTPTK